MTQDPQVQFPINALDSLVRMIFFSLKDIKSQQNRETSQKTGPQV